MESYNQFLSNIKYAKDSLVLILPLLIPALLAAIALSEIAFRARRIKRTKFLPVILAFALFGITVGHFMGASQQPIVSSVLPPLVSLASAYILVQKGSLLDPIVRRALPIGLIVMLTFILYSAWYMKFVPRIPS